MFVRSYAKVNLNLGVIGKRWDGYHEISSLVTKISLYDSIYLKKYDKLSIKCNDKSIPTDSGNIIAKTFKIMQSKYPVIKGIKVNLYKNIPSGAGLGGGSSNAAAFLNAVDFLYSLRMDFSEKKDIMASIGSDTVFFLYNQPAIMRGRGEVIEPVIIDTGFYLLLVKPPISISTGEVYNSGNLALTPEDALSNMQTHYTYSDILKQSYNNLESAVFPKYDVIETIKEKLLDRGADVSLLSGSGATVYGIFSSRKIMESAFEYFIVNFNDCFVKKAVNIN